MVILNPAGAEMEMAAPGRRRGGADERHTEISRVIIYFIDTIPAVIYGNESDFYDL